MIQGTTELANPDFSSYIFSYPKMVEYQESQIRTTTPYPLYKTVFPSWDSEPRKPGRGTIYAYSSPSLYRRWLQTACNWTIKNHPQEERFVFINAWNEWAEGAHLEPDRRFGYGYLEATKDVISKLSD
jgi:lipopolysaccharide biosynthesis protein